MTFPVYCRVTRRNALGTDIQAVVEKSAKELKDAIIEAVIKQAAVSTAVQIGLMFVPIIGQAVAGLVSITQAFTGKYYQKQVDDLVAQTIKDIQDRGAQSTKRIQAAGDAIYVQEMPAAITLAASNQPIDGLGSLASSVRKAVSSVKSKAAGLTQQVTKDAITITRDPNGQMNFLSTITSPVGMARLAVNASLNTAIIGAKGAESAGILKGSTTSNQLTKGRETSNDALVSGQKATSPFTIVQETTGLVAQHGSELVGNALIATNNRKAADTVFKAGAQAQDAAQQTMTLTTPIVLFNTLTGREELISARDACARMRAQSFAAIDKMTSDALAKMNTTEFHTMMRNSIAKKLREDPQFAAQVEGDVKSTSSTGLLVGIGTAVAAAFAFTR